MNIFIWSLYFLLAIAVVLAFSLIFRKIKKKWLLILLSALEVLLSIVFAILVMAGPLILRPIQPFLVALYVVMLPDGLISFILNFTKFRKSLIFKKVFGFTLAVIFFISGTINMSIVSKKEYNLSSNKINNDYNIGFISDIHVGSSQSMDTVKEYINEIKELDLDFLILGGDITDDYTSKENMIEFYSLFKDFSYDVYYLYGNHDMQNNASYANGRTYTIEELEYNITANNITIIKNEIVEVNDDLIICGYADEIDTNREYLESVDSSKYVLYVDHKPNAKEDVYYDLMLSGHTHAGQFAPLNILYDLFITPSYGEYTKFNKKLIVSSGASGWRVPFRSDHHSEYLVININKER